jgi:hypothetical protein
MGMFLEVLRTNVAFNYTDTKLHSDLSRAMRINDQDE